MELYAIRYAEAPFALKYIFGDCRDSDEEVRTDWILYLAVVNGKVILFDTGFRSERDARNWRLTFTGYENELNELLGKRPVDTVVITHSHFDHIDNLDQYPGTKVVIAREALEQAQQSSPEPVRQVLAKAGVQPVEDGALIEGVFRFVVIGGHEAGLAVAYFSHGGREYVLTGDECYCRENALSNRPVGTIFKDAGRNAAFTEDVFRRGLVPLPCHDSAVFELYPKVSRNIARII